jgi:hypothetical protein
MINIHIIGDGAGLYSVKTLLEVNQDRFNDDIQVTGFGDHYFNPAYVRKFSSTLTMEDVIRGADIVVCTNPLYEDDNIVGLCTEFNKPLLCTFLLDEKRSYDNPITRHSSTSIVLDGINLQHAASDMWIKRILNVGENVKEIKHYIGIAKTHETGENALPGLSIDEYQDIISGTLGQPSLIKLENEYFYASEVETWHEDNIDIQTNWIADTDNIDPSKVDYNTTTIFHTSITSKPPASETELVKHSHMRVGGARSLTSWHYLNSSVVCSFVYMWHKGFIPNTCSDYNQIDHSTFVDNIFGARFKLA